MLLDSLLQPAILVGHLLGFGGSGSQYIMPLTLASYRGGCSSTSLVVHDDDMGFEFLSVNSGLYAVDPVCP